MSRARRWHTLRVFLRRVKSVCTEWKISWTTAPLSLLLLLLLLLFRKGEYFTQRNWVSRKFCVFKHMWF